MEFTCSFVIPKTSRHSSSPREGDGGESFLFASKGNCRVLGLNSIKFKKQKKMRMTSVTSVTTHLFV
jgi:hypothetical protein